ncbi:MAG: hypothetical protein M1818_002704 [Claussenomyces sp. TS43310]|nr:MAG: hypothetical protein M1818_002704 [Claussenomyces sp. TS43310]
MELDRHPDIEYPQGRLVISAFEYMTPSISAVKFWDSPAKADLRVKEAISLIMAKYRGDYDMDGNGRGCRYWLLTLFDDLEQARYITGKAPSHLGPVAPEDVIDYYNSSHGIEPKAIPMYTVKFDPLSASDAELVAWCKTAQFIHGGECFEGIVQPSSDVIVKIGGNVTAKEAANQAYAHEQLKDTDLYVPQVYRYFSYEQECIRKGYIMME